MARRTAALALAAAVAATVASAGCSPLLYLMLQARSSNGGQAVTVGQEVTGSTAGAGDNYTPQCMSEDARDQTWTFIAPATARYRFTVRGDYDTVLAVAQVSGHELACNDDHGSTRESQVEIPLERGERTSVVIDGYHGATGNYTLRVDDVATLPAVAVPPPGAPTPGRVVTDTPAMAARCATAPVLTPGVIAGTLDSTVATASVTCGNSGPGGDVVYRFEAPSPGTLSVAESSFFDAIVEIRDGCGAQRHVLACNDDAPDTRHAAVSAHIPAGTAVVVVDSFSPAGSGQFALLVSWVPDGVLVQAAQSIPVQVPPPVPQPATVQAVPGGVQGTVVGGPRTR